MRGGLFKKKHDNGWSSVRIFVSIFVDFLRGGGGATFCGHTKPGKYRRYFSLDDFVYIIACIQLHLYLAKNPPTTFIEKSAKHCTLFVLRILYI